MSNNDFNSLVLYICIGFMCVFFWIAGLVRDPNEGYVDNLAPMPTSVSKNRVADYTVNGSSIFKSRINDSINDLKKHDASYRLIKNAGHFTINEDPAPCSPPPSDGCSFIKENRIQIKNLEDSRWMNVVLIHEIAHISIPTTSECLTVKADVDYMRSSDQYKNYHKRANIEYRLTLVC